MRKILFILTALVLILTSCEHKDYFAFDDVSFVRNFPNKYVLGKADTLDVELIGIHGVKSFGNYLLVSCAAPKGCLSTVTLGKETKVTNTFLMIGSGPGEVLYRPYISWMSFYEKDGGCKAGVYDYAGSFIELDVSQDSLSNAYRYLSRSLDTCRVLFQQDLVPVISTFLQTVFCVVGPRLMAVDLKDFWWILWEENVIRLRWIILMRSHLQNRTFFRLLLP